MADERIVLSYDPATAIAGAAQANKAIASNEKTAEQAGIAIVKATDAQATSVVSITDKSLNALNNIVRQAERKASLASGTPADRLREERALQLSRVAGNQEAVNRVTAAYDKLKTAQEAAAGNSSKLAEALRNPLEAASGAVEALAGGLGKIGAIGLAAGAGIAAAAKAGFDLVASQGRAAEAVSNFADTVGISATEAYKLDIQAKLVGSSLEALTGGYKKLAQGIAEGSDEGKKSAAALEAMGVRIFDLNGKVRPFQELFGDIAKKIQAIQEPSARAAKAVEILGKSGLSLMPLLLQFQETGTMAEKAAAGINDPLLKTLAAADDKIGLLSARWEAMKAILAGKILAVIEIVEVDEKKDTPGSLQAFLKSQTAEERLKRFASESRQREFGPTSPVGEFVNRAEGAEANRKARAAEGERLIAQYRAARGQDDAGLKERLAAITVERKAAEQFGPGMGAPEVQKRIDLAAKLRAEEHGLTAQIKARAEAEQKAEAARKEREKGLEKAREIMAQRAAGGFKVDVIKDLGEQPVNKIYEEKFHADQKLSEQTLEMELGNIKEQFSQEEILAAASRDKQLAEAEGFNARTLEQKLALEEKKAVIEREYLLKNYAIKAQILQVEQDLELAKAGESAELRHAINEKYALAGRELTLRTEAAIGAAGTEAAIKSGRLIQDQAQKNFDSIKHAAEGLFDALFSRTKSWGDLLKNAVLLPALTYLKQIASTMVASALTGGGGGGGGSASGIGGLLGGLLNGGGIASAGAPGGTGGFAGPVGMSGGGGFGNVGGALGGFAGMKSSALGLLTKLGNLGGPALGPGSSGGAFGGAGVHGAAGGAMLAGGGILAYDGLRRGGFIGLAETTAGGALIGAKFGGPIGALIGGAIGAAAGTARLFIKGAQEKLISKIKALYGINVDTSFAKNPLMGIIKDQFGGNIDVGIRSPQVRELLAIYRMQSNQSGAGSGLGALNDTARGVSLSGYGGSVYQNPVSVAGASYGYGGSLPSTGPAAPFAPDERPIVIENKIMIDGRDVQASVQRTNQASNGRRESAAVLSDPMLIFG